MNQWLPVSPCDTGCVTDQRPALPSSAAAGRVVRMLGALAAPGPDRASRVLNALGIRLHANTKLLSAAPGTLVVANHVSWLDLIALNAVEPLVPLAKREVAAWPVIGGMARRGGAVFIDRGNLRALPGTVAELAAVLRSGRSVLVFPEGTTWCGRRTGRFHTAAFQAALDAGALVRPVSVRYTQAGQPSTVAAYLGSDSLLSSLARVAHARDLAVRVTAHPVVRADNRRELARAAWTSVSELARV
ncbi:lysophospholipid acyltransferase family protein [Kutzneria viridogrisea]|uniref:1-acyl-sn-glycerol-3-phosphate acyltransferase n=1 Tax=Kutzneria viridogrisea TaxID=47990 RepID=A0ABR6BSM5_9PSEU|nr:1-acyl-sn-glycerol-3-phosphate acyltransferase [Kutzneria viridogrisea]